MTQNLRGPVGYQTAANYDQLEAPLVALLFMSRKKAASEEIYSIFHMVGLHKMIKIDEQS